MAQEIDQFLMAQFSSGLEGKEDSVSRIPLYSQFLQIKTLLEEILRSSVPEKRIRANLYYLNDVLTECQMLSKSNLLTLNKIRMKLNKIKRELSQLTKDLKDGITASNGKTSGRPDGTASTSEEKEVFQWSSRSVDASKVHGFDNEVISLEKLLLREGSEDHFKAIGIVGIAGIGKTTLCQVIFNKPEVKDYFLPRIWLCMSRKPDEDADPRVAIAKRMLVCLGVEEEIINNVYEGHGLMGLLYALHRQLAGKRYLIVFDNARDIDSWYAQLNSSVACDEKWDCLAYGLPKGYGGAVIVTSRNEELAKKMVGKEIRRILPLSDPDTCWSIFKDAVERNGRKFNPSNAEDLKKDILPKCGGLPLAAKIMGQITYQQLRKEASPNGIQQE